MATNNVPKHDFAPAWLKIPSEENPKSSGAKLADDKSSRARKEDNFHNSFNNRYGPDYRLHRQHSFDNYYDGAKRYPPGPNKHRHHSVDDDYYAYSYGPYSYYSGYNAYDKYNLQYGSQHSLLRPPGTRESKYQHPNARFAQQMNGAYPSYYDLYPYEYGDYYQGDPYYSGYPNRNGPKRSFHDKDGRRDFKDNDRVRENGKDKAAFNNEFPCLNGEGEPKESGNSKTPVNGAWENSPVVKPTAGSTSRSENNSPGGSNKEKLYKAIVTNKGPLPRKVALDEPKLNGNEKPPSPTNTSGTMSVKEGTRQSPTSPIEILSSRYGTQPKIFTDKKADILKIIRNENAEDNSDNGLENNNNDKDSKMKHSNMEVLNGLDRLSVEEPDCHLSSSLEAEQRLLREMGWNEAADDEEEYVITEDDKLQFQNLSKQVKVQPNGIVRALPKQWSPKHIPVYEPTEGKDSYSLSSDTDSDDDDSC